MRPSTANVSEHYWSKPAEQPAGTSPLQSVTRPVEKKRKCKRISYPGLRDVWRSPPSLENIKFTRMRYSEKKIQKFLSRRDRSRMFSRAPLWLSTGLSATLGFHPVAFMLLLISNLAERRRLSRQ